MVKSGFGMGSMRVIALSWGKPDYLGVTILGEARLSDALCFIAVGVDTDGGLSGLLARNMSTLSNLTPQAPVF